MSKRIQRMKFGKEIQKSVVPEWGQYCVDYKCLKKVTKAVSAGDSTPEAFWKALDDQIEKVTLFLVQRENWFGSFSKQVQNEIAGLLHVDPMIEDERKQDCRDDSNTKQCIKAGKCFDQYIYAKKSLLSLNRELELLAEFVSLQRVCLEKILKKFMKKTGISATATLRLLNDTTATGELFQPFRSITQLQELVRSMFQKLNVVQPLRPAGWYHRKVYTIGCFDLFHRGHESMLKSLLEFGTYIIVGVHDDHSYQLLKNKPAIDSIEVRLEKVKPYADMVFVIPSTDPTPYIRAMVSDGDIKEETCCYVRGDDMEYFPGRVYVESVMPIYMLPRYEGVSSTLIRRLYHSEPDSAS